MTSTSDFNAEFHFYFVDFNDFLIKLGNKFVLKFNVKLIKEDYEENVQCQILVIIIIHHLCAE